MTLFRALALLLTAAATPAIAVVTDAEVTRTSTGLAVAWKSAGAVDVFVADRADATPATARLVSDDDADGRFELPANDTARRYFLLREGRAVMHVAERQVPLAQGSNFRDIGGYAGANGKHVRWGMIYRSGATPLLTEGDVAQVRALGLRNLIDLRSSEERVLAPTKLRGIPYTAIDYSMADMLPRDTAALQNGAALYRNFPTAFAPQLRLIFDDLLARQGPIAYNCSAGQDRTGFATAMILSALGVPRDTIVADYHLSTADRRPQYEMPKINLAAHPGNAAAQLFARYQDDPRAAMAQPLKEADGSPFLAGAFDEIDRRWGSVDAYLEKEVGVNRVELAALRAAYLE